MKIKILATDRCSNCKKLCDMVYEKIKEYNINAEIEKITDINKIIEYGVMMPPALVVDEKVVFSGGLPTKKQLDGLLKQE